MNIASIPKRTHASALEYAKVIEEFLASSGEAYEVVFPEGREAWNIYSALRRQVNKLGAQDKVRIRVVESKSVYLVRQ